MAAICLTCRHYDDKPDPAGDLPETYGLCRWPLPDRPAFMPGHVPTQDAGSGVSRRIARPVLSERPDLTASCHAHTPRAVGA
ncbi:hypothetical protein [uncultured Methylobacterium sp.]|uniref:hypothetical protein n=1 Tax=uncultured Methylobacterium sp. TaxID=157278 RepID=UPI0035CA9DE6